MYASIRSYVRDKMTPEEQDSKDIPFSRYEFFFDFAPWPFFS